MLPPLDPESDMDLGLSRLLVSKVSSFSWRVSAVHACYPEAWRRRGGWRTRRSFFLWDARRSLPVPAPYGLRTDGPFLVSASGIKLRCRQRTLQRTTERSRRSPKLQATEPSRRLLTSPSYCRFHCHSSFWPYLPMAAPARPF